jgi:hypothetical protein
MKRNSVDFARIAYASFEVTAFRKTAAADNGNAFCFGSRSDGNDPLRAYVCSLDSSIRATALSKP